MNKFKCTCKGIIRATIGTCPLHRAAWELYEALNEMVKGKVVGPHQHAVHSSKMFCSICGMNSETKLHCVGCPVDKAEAALAKARGE